MSEPRYNYAWIGVHCHHKGEGMSNNFFEPYLEHTRHVLDLSERLGQVRIEYELQL